MCFLDSGTLNPEGIFRSRRILNMENIKDKISECVFHKSFNIFYSKNIFFFFGKKCFK